MCGCVSIQCFLLLFFFFLMIRRPPRSTRTTHSFPTRRSSDLLADALVDEDVGVYRHADAEDDAGNARQCEGRAQQAERPEGQRDVEAEDRKSTRLNSSH